MIDYFYDLSLLREGDGINFQKASATLDGCVKIYSSRVDSAVTETGRLINGLATSKRNQVEDEGDDDEEDEDDELDPNAPVRERKSKASVSQKSTIVEFKVIKLKKMDLELYVDPLFKKALTDFDEGGSKSLLLNMLHVNEKGKIMFDTTDSAMSQAVREEIPQEKEEQEQEDEEEADMSMNDIENSFAEMDIDEPLPEPSLESMSAKIQSLGQRFLSHYDNEVISVCPSMNELNAVLNQKATSSDLLKGLENTDILESYEADQDQDFGDFDFGPNDDIDLGSFHDNTSRYPGNKTSIFFDDLEDEADDYGITMRELFNEDKSYGVDHDDEAEQITSITNIPDENLLAYFDENQRNNWAGPEHWKIQRLKNIFKSTSKDIVPTDENTEGGESHGSGTSKKRTPKEHLVIDFLSDEFPDEDDMFTPGGSTILLPKKDWISKTKHVLPDDRHFTTKNFINLFLKEKLINSTFNKVKNLDQAIDESLYAENMTINDLNQQPENINNADFYNDDMGGDFDLDDDFGPDHITPQSQEAPSSQLLIKSQGKQSPLNYSRVAKKVDIKVLKDNLLDSLKKETTTRKSMSFEPPQLSDDSGSSSIDETLKFTDVIHGLNDKYDKDTKKDLSTSFCFICLLHLANENGLTLTNNDDNSDLIINNFEQLV